MKPIDVKSDFYAKYNVDSNTKNGTFKAGDHVQISKHRNVFPKEYTPNWSKVFFSYWQN